jgi:hypothetical protein
LVCGLGRQRQQARPGGGNDGLPGLDDETARQELAAQLRFAQGFVVGLVVS